MLDRPPPRSAGIAAASPPSRSPPGSCSRCARSPRRLARRRLPARGPARRLGLGPVAGDLHRAALRAGLQLLPPAAHRTADDRRLRERRRARRLLRRRGRGQRAGRARPAAHARGRRAPPRGRPRRRDGAGAAARRARRRAARGRAPARAGARPAVGGDRSSRRPSRRRAASASRCATTPGRSAPLVVPDDTGPVDAAPPAERIVAALEALLAAALERDELLAGRVEAAALRRSDASRPRCCARSPTTCARR